MGQLSAYRFPESSGWEKVWSWTLETESQQRSSYYGFSNDNWDYDIYFFVGRNFLADNDVSNNLNSIVNISITDTTSDTTNVKRLAISSYDTYGAKRGQKATSDFCACGFNIIGDFGIVKFVGSVSYSAYFNTSFNDYKYINIYTSYVNIQPGATIDFYGMNLPK